MTADVLPAPSELFGEHLSYADIQNLHILHLEHYAALNVVPRFFSSSGIQWWSVLGDRPPAFEDSVISFRIRQILFSSERFRHGFDLKANPGCAGWFCVRVQSHS